MMRKVAVSLFALAAFAVSGTASGAAVTAGKPAASEPTGNGYRFCQDAGLSTNGVQDCENSMDAATTTADREKVRKIFGHEEAGGPPAAPADQKRASK
jgi:hypothetical protein